MKIELTISERTLGDDNTEEENQRYVDAVEKKIKQEYPNADVLVNLESNVDAGSCWASCEEVTGEVMEIAQNIWDHADY